MEDPLNLATFDFQKSVVIVDSRRKKIVPGELNKSLKYAVEHFLATAQFFIEKEGSFHVALSGGNTPKTVYEGITSPTYRSCIDWAKVNLYWSDERCVAPYDPSSNYRMAMEAGLSGVGIPAEQIHRMQAEGNVEEGAAAYNELLLKKLPKGRFHLVLLGVGEDGHTASLFPGTPALKATNRWVVANRIESKNMQRMTLTFDCINAAERIVFYAFGSGKATIVKKVLGRDVRRDEFPSAGVGTEKHPALWILDQDANE